MTQQTPTFQRYEPRKGLTILHEQREVPPVDAIRIFFPIGSARETRDEEGLAYLTSRIMTRQTKNRNLYEFARFVDDRGLKISSTVSPDHINFSFTGTRNFRTPLLEIVQEILTKPDFPADALERLRTQQLASIRERADQSFPYAMDQSRRAFYQNHAYGHYKYGRRTTVKDFKPSDCETFARKHLRKGPVVVSHVGGISPEEIESMFTERDLTMEKTKYQAVDKTGQGREKRRKDVDQPTHVLMYPAPTASDQQYLPTKLLDTLLGSGMSSLLFEEMRENRSLGYQTGSSFPSRTQGSHFAVYLGGDAESNGKTFRSVFEGISKNLAENGPSKQQFREAQEQLKGNFLLDHETPGQRAWYRGFYEILGRTAEFDRHFTHEVESVNQEHIQKLASAIFVKNEPLFLTVS